MASKTTSKRATSEGVPLGAPFEAVVVEVPREGAVKVRAATRLREGEGRARRRLAARVAVVDYAASAGDRVVVIEGAKESFVVGVLHAARRAGEADVVRAESGASASANGSAIEVRDASGALVVSYDAATGETRLVAPGGDLVLAARGKVRVEAGSDLDLRAAGEVRSTSTRVSVHATEGEVNAERLSVTAAEHRALVGRWELRAQRVIEQVVDAYRDVDGLLQTRAGRMRTLVKGAFRVLAERTDLLSREDAVIDGKRVLLG
jgi:hypothetical protein